MKYFSLLSFILLMGTIAMAQNEAIYNDDPFQKHPLGYEPPEYQYRTATGATVNKARVEPPFWWLGMAEQELEILIYDETVRDLVPVIEHQGITVVKATRLENPNYLFVTIQIDTDCRPGTFDITLNDENGQTQKTIPYELQEKSTDSQRYQGVDASDLIYLIMPDRFANGDTGNDSFDDMEQVGINRDKVFFRHGGDLIGIMEHLDYLEELGATALWINPVLENDQPSESYHGYAITDHYAIDRRFGNNDQYQRLVGLAHARGMKVIMDVIFNHTGDHHWFIQDLPSEDWIHQWKDEPLEISYRAPVHLDPHAAPEDYARVTESWFDQHMPDLNQAQPQLANYLIQNSIWWTALTGQDGFRVDTYAYCDPDFMSEWNGRMLEEFPSLSIFGETWVHGPGIQSWFTAGERAGGHNSQLPGVTDFQLFYAITEALNQEQGWTSGVAKLYYTLAQDYLYESPNNNVVFLDNHDLNRIYGTLGKDMTKFKSAMSLLLTMRGIPMLYYGTEMLMSGSGGGFGEGGRQDFLGGWRKDRSNNLFKEKRRSEEQNEAFSFISKLAHYRQNHTVLQTGELTQYVPEDGVYVFFRHNENEKVMIVYNSNITESTVSTQRYKLMIAGHNTGVNILTDELINDLTELNLQAKETIVISLQE